MGKRELEKKPKSPRDFYATIDPDAVKPLLPYIKGLKYAEPMCGKGDLINLIGDTAECRWASDIHMGEYFGITPMHWRDATTIDLDTFMGIDCIISNPPFSKALLLPIMDHLLKSGKPLWLLLPADMLHNKYMAPYMEKCELVLSIGRLCWFPCETTGKMIKGVDNNCWYKFTHKKCDTIFKGRLT